MNKVVLFKMLLFFVSSFLVLYARNVYAAATATFETCVSLEKLENTKDKKVMLSGFVPLLNSVPSRTRDSVLVLTEAIIFAIEEANTKILPEEWSLGYTIYDSCGETHLDITTQAILSIIFGDLNQATNYGNDSSQLFLCDCQAGEEREPINLGVVGPGSSTMSVYLSTALSYFGLPIISYYASSVELNNKLRYPNFFRTIPDDSRFAEALVDVVMKYGWSYVSIVSSDNSYGRYGRQELLKRFKLHKICINFDEMFKVPYDVDELTTIVRLIKNGQRHGDTSESSASVVIIYATEEACQQFLKVAQHEQLFGITWILSDGTGIGQWHSTIDSRVINGSFTILNYAGPYEKFEEYFWNPNNTNKLNKWLNSYLAFNNATNTADVQQKLNTGMSTVGYIRNAVFVYAHALKNYIEKNCLNIDSSCLVNTRTVYESEFPSITLTGALGEDISFDREGNVKYACYNILNIYAPSTKFNGTKIDNVGYWTSTGQFKERLNMTSRMQWNTGSSKPPVSQCSNICGPGTYPFVKIGTECCWACVSCPPNRAKPEIGNWPCTECSVYSNSNRTKCLEFREVFIRDYGITLLLLFILSVCGSALCVVALFIIFIRRKSPVIKAGHMKLSFIHVCVQLLLFITLMATNLMEKTTAFCLVKFILLGSLPPLIVTFLLVKSEQLRQIFKAKRKMSKRQVALIKSQGYGIILSSMGVYLVVVFSIVFTTPALLDVEYDQLKLTKETYCKNSFHVFMFEFFFITFLIIVCGIQAFRTRNLPGEYNDGLAVLCTVFSLFFSFIAVIILLYLGNFTRAESDLAAAFGLCVANYFTLIILYGRKCWSALRRPKKKRCSRGLSRFQNSGIVYPKIQANETSQ